VVVRSTARRSLHFHRHAHELWLPLDPAEVVYSERARWVRARPPAIYIPPYAMHSWKALGDKPGRLLGFVAAPEDEPTHVDERDQRLRDSADGRPLDLDAATARWMLDKLQLVSIAGTQRIGPFARDAAFYVVAGTGSLAAHSIAAHQLVTLAAATSVEVTAASPLTLLVFDPARSTVSPILKEGAKRYSQDDEELIIRDFFRDRRGGFFVDVGAGDYQRDSTTFYLEEQLGWSGVAIDALAEYAEGYRQHRKRTRFVNLLVTDRARGAQKFYRADGSPELSSVSKQLAEKQLGDGGVVSERMVATGTLDGVLDHLGVSSVDFLSMDIEEHEPEALAGFDIDRFHPALACVEAHPAVRDTLWRYFRRHGYVRQDQYLAWDSANWYFARR
jgi:FkbM family methyltransferase